MKVETFECVEHDAVSDPEAWRLIEELGLEGQQTLVTSDGQRSPYRAITSVEDKVYRALCPQSTVLEKYAGSPIPLRVLQVAAHARSLGIYAKLLVWDRASVEVDDPVLVGQTTETTWETGHRIDILARWGEDLEPFAVLAKRAREVLAQSARDRLLAVRGKVEADIASIDSVSIEKIPLPGHGLHYSGLMD